MNKVSIEFSKGDILDTKASRDIFNTVGFDVIVSNPPYVRHLEKSEMRPNVLDYEPHLALFVKDNDPLVYYRNIVNFAQKRLKPEGMLFLEINHYLGTETLGLFSSETFEKVELLKDLSGNDRFVMAKRK